MKKILIFSLSYYPHVGGAEVAIKEITDRTSREDREFHMVTLRFAGDARQEQIGNVTVHRVGNGAGTMGKVLFIPRAFFEALRLHRTVPFDSFWAMMSYMLFPIVLLRWWGVSVPYLLTLQEGDPFEHVFKRWRILPFRPLLTYGFKHATAVQSISTFLAQWAVQAGFRGTPEIIPNAVDTEHFSQENTEKECCAMREKLSVKKDDVLLVTTSRLVHKNAVDDVIRALTRLPESIHFVVYGIGPDEQMLRELAKKDNVERRVHFMGQISHKDMPSALKCCDIFIRTSRSEGMGNSFIEAMAAELPVIATQEGGIRDFLFDAKRNHDKETTGWAVDKDSPEQIAEAVRSIIEHPEQVVRVTSAAKRMVLKHYDWDDIAIRMGRLFKRLYYRSGE